VQKGEADLLPPEPTQQNEVPERGDSASQMTLEL